MSDRLKSFVDRIERLEEEQRGIGGDKKDVYTEVKSAGFNPKALRKIIQQRRAKPDPEMEADLDTYRVALGMAVNDVANGASLREAATKRGISKSVVHRAVPREEKTDAGTATQEERDAARKTLVDAGLAAEAERLGLTVVVRGLAAKHDEPDLTIPPFLDKRVSA